MNKLMLNVRIQYAPMIDKYVVELYSGMKYVGKTYKSKSEVEKIKRSGIIYNIKENV